MALEIDKPNTNYNIGVKIEGDLGDLQVIEESDSENDISNQQQKVLRTFHNKPNIPSNLIQNTVPVFSKVTVANSEHVQLGNNTYFNGPVTIKQIIQNKSGIDNSSYVRDKDEDAYDHHQPHEEKVAKTGTKIPILLWHKITFSTVCIAIIGSIIAIVILLPYKSEQHNTQPNFETFTSANTTVVGLCIQNLQVIIMSMIVVLLTLILFFSLLTQEGIGSIVLRSQNIQNNVHIPPMKYFRDDPLLISSDHLRIVSRAEWLAQPVEGELTKLKLPAPWVIIAHTATESCFSQSQCVYRVRLIQMFHIESRGWSDIGYNFLIGGDGSVYYGRGWEYEGAHTKSYNKYSIGIAFIGTFNVEAPTKGQVEACEKLLELGVRLGKLPPDYKLFAHKQLMSTLSPGDKIYSIIRNWHHFVHNVTDLDSLIPKLGS